jgi:hypothetical protein
VRLQLDRCAVVFLVERMAGVERLTFQLEVILHQHPVEEDRRISRSLHRTIIVERWGGPHHVVSLPISGLATRVHQRNALLVDTPSLAVDVRFVVVRIENLQLVAGIAGAGGGEKDAAIAARLTAAGDILRDLPLDVELIVPKAPLGFDIADTWRFAHSQYTVGDDPFGGRPVLAETHSSRFLPSNSTIASEGGAALLAPGVTILGTGSDTSVSWGFGAAGC